MGKKRLEKKGRRRRRTLSTALPESFPSHSLSFSHDHNIKRYVRLGGLDGGSGKARLTSLASIEQRATERKKHGRRQGESSEVNLGVAIYPDG